MLLGAQYTMFAWFCKKIRNSLQSNTSGGDVRSQLYWKPIPE